MPSFTELLTASDADLVKYFYKVNSDPDEDFILRINKAAKQLDLNHSQLVCALGFNKFIRDLSDIYSSIGFRSYKLLSYRSNELLSTDTYSQLSIDNIIDIYSERLEDEQILESLREILSPRLEHIEAEIGKSEDPGQIISYRMEVHSIYTAGIVGKEFAEERLNKDIGKFRLMANEANIIVENGFFPPSNMFFMETLDPLERKDLIDGGHIDTNMIKNRMQNSDLSEEEREILEEYI